MLYRNLIGKGFLPIESMNTLRQTGSPLQGHPCMRTPGVDMPSARWASVSPRRRASPSA